MRQYYKESKNPFHIYSRGVDKRIIFVNDFDRERFLILMYICNIGSPLYLTRKNISPAVTSILFKCEKLNEGLGLFEEEHEPLVAFISWALMPNHFHFLIVSLVEGGISKFMQKLSNAYTKYFNKRHERDGSLFQSSYQSIEVADEEYLYHLSRYINLNPAELKESGWKENGIREWSNMREFLKNYKWSSYPDLVGERQSILLDKNLIEDLFGETFGKRHGVGLKDYERFTEEWLVKDLDFIEKYILEH